jgi:hypothetical protein
MKRKQMPQAQSPFRTQTHLRSFDSLDFFFWLWRAVCTCNEGPCDLGNKATVAAWMRPKAKSPSLVKQ